jgi:Spy/CpxP family protein refolding chaperone
MGHVPHDFDFYLILANELSFSEEQVKQLQSIRSECEKNGVMIKARIKVGELELQELLNQSELDTGKVDAKIKEIGEIKIENDINDIHAMIDAKSVLTPEQKEKLKNLRPIPCNSHF